MRLVLLFIAALSAACSFFDGTPAGSVLLCGDDAECPNALRCNLATHVCVDPSDVLPPLAAASFSPAALSTGVVTLTIAADEDLAPDVVPELSWAPGVAPPFFPGAVTDTRIRAFTLDTIGQADGVYRLTGVGATDAAGNFARTDVDVAFAIDRLAPAILSPIVDDATPGDGSLRISDGAVDNEVSLSFGVDEPLADSSPTVGLGRVVWTCSALAGQRFECGATIDAGAVDAGDRLTIEAVDPAGNRTFTEVSVSVDVAAPRVVDGTVIVRLDGGDTVRPGGRVEVEFVVDEDLGAPPGVELAGGLSLPLAIDLLQGRRTVVFGVVPVGTPAASYPIVVSIVDTYAHPAAGVEIGAVRVTDVLESPCVIPPVGAQGITCTDFDGDGQAGLSFGCTGDVAVDCNDGDATVFDGAVEIPGDGKANDCGGDGQDAPIDEATGVFVDPAAAAGGDGTRGAPFTNFDDALFAARGSGRALFVAPGVHLTSQALDVTVVGGFLSGTTWQRALDGAGASLPSGTLSVDAIGGAQPTALHAVRIDAGSAFTAGDVTLARVAVTNTTLFTSGIMRLVDVEMNGGSFDSSGSLRVIDSRIDSSMSSGGTASLLRTVLAQDVLVVDGSLQATACGFLRGIRGQGTGGTISLVHCNVTGGTEAAINVRSGEKFLDIVNVASEAPVFVVMETNNSSVSMKGVLFDGPVLLQLFDESSNLLVAEIPSSAPEDLVPTGRAFAVEQVLVGGVAVDADGLHTTPGLGAGAGVDPFSTGAPTSAVGDVDGDCRTPPYDIGADEYE